jgi:serine/threonine protein phosphatase PrpC
MCASIEGTKAKYNIEACLLSDVGCQRERNEDRILFFKLNDPVLLERKGSIAVVADGIGGHMAGEVASGLAIEVIQRTYYEDTKDTALALKRAFETANQEIYEASSNDQAYRGMGTTCTALVLKNGLAYCAHIGDSRLYLIRGGEIFLMTEDHTVVMDLVRSGILSAEEAHHHPDKNIISRALGTNSNVEVSIWTEPFPVQESDIFILCSDGLHDLVENDEIKQIATSEDLHTACEGLIALAKERGGYDNISIGLFRIKAASSSVNKAIPKTRIV